jgi:hypothetical protein
MFSLRNLTVPQVLAGLIALLGLAGAIAYAVTQTGQSSADVTEAWRQEIIDGSSMLRQVGVTKANAITYVAAQTGMTTTEADPLVSQSYGAGRDPLAVNNTPISYLSTVPNSASWTRQAENACIPLLFRGPSTSIYTTCMTDNNVVGGIHQCSTTTNLRVGRMQRINLTATSAERAFYMEANSPVTGLKTITRADEATAQAAFGWQDCPWYAGEPEDPYMPQLAASAPSYLLLVATITGTVTQAPGGLAFSISPAGVVGTCVVVGSSYTCVVTRPGGSSKNQTLTLTATGVDADGNPGTTAKTVALVYP